MSSGLGKGLGSLFGASPEEFNNMLDGADPEQDIDDLRDGDLLYVPIDQVDTQPDQPRRDFNEERLASLAESIAAHGVMEPLLAVRLPSGRFRLLAGERRYRAARMAGLDEVPVIMREVDDSEAMQLALTENIQREDLNPIEQAAAMQSLMSQHGLSQVELAKSLAMSRSAVANYLRLNMLPESVQKMVASGDLSMGHAKALLGLATTEEISVAAETVVRDGLNVRATEQLVRSMVEKAARRQEQSADAATPKHGKTAPPEFVDAQSRMSQYLDTKVRIVGSPKKGRITIEYSSPEELERLYAHLGGPAEEPE